MPNQNSYFLPNMAPNNFVDLNTSKIIPNIENYDLVNQSDLIENASRTKKKRSEKLNLAQINSVQDANKCKNKKF